MEDESRPVDTKIQGANGDSDISSIASASREQKAKAFEEVSSGIGSLDQSDEEEDISRTSDLGADEILDEVAEQRNDGYSTESPNSSAGPSSLETSSTNGTQNSFSSNGKVPPIAQDEGITNGDHVARDHSKKANGHTRSNGTGSNGYSENSEESGSKGEPEKNPSGRDVPTTGDDLRSTVVTLNGGSEGKKVPRRKYQRKFFGQKKDAPAADTASIATPPENDASQEKGEKSKQSLDDDGARSDPHDNRESTPEYFSTKPRDRHHSTGALLDKDGSAQTVMRTVDAKSRRKAVRFADALGLELVTTLKYHDTDRLLEDAVSSHPIMDSPLSVPARTKKLTFKFDQPVTAPDFYDRLEAQNVILECATSSNAHEISFLVRVINLDYCKTVYMHWSNNNWRTQQDTKLEYMSCDKDGYHNLFHIEKMYVGQPGMEHSASTEEKDLPILAKVDFCVVYHVKGQRFWDSNHGNNYVAFVDWEQPSAEAFDKLARRRIELAKLNRKL